MLRPRVSSLNDGEIDSNALTSSAGADYHLSHARLPSSSPAQLNDGPFDDIGRSRVEPWNDGGACFAYEFGEQYDSYQASETKFHQFWSENYRGLISYAVSGRQVLVRGGLIAPPEHQEELLRQFLEFTQARKYRVSFLNMSKRLIPLFRKHGFSINKWGEEPIVDPQNTTFKGKSFEWVRRQTNYCIRHGLVAQEIDPDDLTVVEWERLLAELKDVAADTLKCKAQSRELQFFEGELHSHPLGYRRLFVARGDWGGGRIEGFVVCNPIQAGRAWSTEIYRHRQDSVRGTVAFLFQHIIHKIREEGVSRLHLCIVPGLGCLRYRQGESRLVHLGFRYGGPLMSSLFDIDGLHHFKSRFRPRYEDRYVFSNPQISLGTLLAFFNVLGIFKLNPCSLTRILYQRFMKCTQRKTLVGIS